MTTPPIIILDAGHRPQTPGKRSPDGKLIEHQWATKCRQRVADLLRAAGLTPVLQAYSTAPTESADLNSRVRNINQRARAARCIAVSIHCNACAADGRWHTARGWCIFVAPNASETSKHLAESIFAQAKAAGFKTRQQYHNVGYWTQSLAFCRDTICPAVLIENFFMDNPEDCAYLLTQQSIDQCAAVIAQGIIDHLKG